MADTLSIDYAVRSEAGDKAENADAADARVPKGGLLLAKGVAAAVADGVSSSEGGKQASEVCITGFLSDYFSTPESWTVKHSVGKVLGALNRWLHAQGQTRFQCARGMVSTFSGLVIKSTTAHVFHVGDCRIYHFRAGLLEQLTRDHRVWIGKDREFLSRAMGVDPHVDIDYRSLAVEPEDLFLFTTDGVHGHLSDNRLAELLCAHRDSPQTCVNLMTEEALRNGSGDNVTCQLLKVLRLPTQSEDDILQQLNELPFPPPLAPGMTIDGYQILRELHASKRSEVFLALDPAARRQVTLKTPSVNFRDDPDYLEDFLHEEWVGRRIDNAHVLKVLATPHRRFLYNLSEHVRGQTLRQWLHDHPRTDINLTRDFVQQLAEGLRAFHRLDMLHLDLKPENVLVDERGTLKIIDFGSTRVAGAAETQDGRASGHVQGTLSYTAPECLDGLCSNRSDIYSLGVIAYELLTGALPYGESDQPRARPRLRYVSARRHDELLAPWVDGALHKAVRPDPRQRYDSLSEFLRDLSHPNQLFIDDRPKPLLERNPIAFWQALSALLILGHVIWLYHCTH